jgi:hypothetical protein
MLERLKSKEVFFRSFPSDESETLILEHKSVGVRKFYVRKLNVDLTRLMGSVYYRDQLKERLEVRLRTYACCLLVLISEME